MAHILSDHEKRETGFVQNNQRRWNGEERRPFESLNSRLPRRPRHFSREDRRDNGFCVHWNNGNCIYEEFCRFLHEESPLCHFQENCMRKDTCRYFHEAQSFLGQRLRPGQTK